MTPFIIVLLCLFGLTTSQECSGYEDHPLVVVSMDGFRAEYLSRGLTPNIQAVKDRGVSPPYMKATYPTITFPNHYAIVTGLYPESHGIIDNDFYDPTFNASFSLGSDESLDGRWWGGEPIWNTVIKQGKKSATFFWPGSDADIQGMHPTYYYRYDDTIPYEDRVDQVLSWLALPESERPSWICLYFDEPDHTGHWDGPNSPEVNGKLVEVDMMIGRLVDGIADLNLTNCVNLFLLADHGMAESGQERYLDLADFVPELDQMAVTYEGAFVRIDVEEEYEDQQQAIRQNLTCQQPELRQYVPSGLPTRYHYSNNVRIGNIVLDLTVGYSGNVDSSFYLEGQHGYDNYYTDMQPIFMAAGPEFPAGAEVEPFQNIELYNLMCHLTGVIPAPNNGTEASLYHLLVSPPSYPALNPEDPPTVPPFPSEEQIAEQQHISGCPGDDSAPLTLNFTLEEEEAILETQLPWGIPLSGDLPADLLLLYQDDHVTGFSEVLKMPLWTSFTITNSPNEPTPSEWSSDVRLTEDNSPTCLDYEQMAAAYNVSMKPLFPNRYGSVSADVNYIVSNAVPITQNMASNWDYLVETLLERWLLDFAGPLNVIVGPVFDINSDSHVDNFTLIETVPTVPTDLFLIVTRCVSETPTLNECATDELDSLAFIYPEFIKIANCMSMDNFALEFSAKVKDVEIATGFTFFPAVPYEDRTRLAIRIHSSLWS